MKMPAFSTWLFVAFTLCCSCGKEPLEHPTTSSRLAAPLPQRIIPGELFFRMTVEGQTIEIRENQSLHMAGNIDQNSGPQGCALHTSTHFQDTHNHHIERNIHLSLYNIFIGEDFCRNYDFYRFFPSLIETGKRDFHLHGVRTHLAEAGIKYRDELGVDWYSQFGEQEKHHKFIIRQSYEIHGPLYPVQLTQRVGGSFNCLLFDEHGNQMEVEHGEFFVDFQYAN
ncbi:MAG: hypothetical protein AAF598_09680 [Bacteroidota bacterium]